LCCKEVEPLPPGRQQISNSTASRTIKLQI
jgi:hypothetical protein